VPARVGTKTDLVRRIASEVVLGEFSIIECENIMIPDPRSAQRRCAEPFKPFRLHTARAARTFEFVIRIRVVGTRLAR